MLLAEELALVSLNPESGRHAVGIRTQLNACLAGLLVAELVLDGVVEPHGSDGVAVAIGRYAIDAIDAIDFADPRSGG